MTRPWQTLDETRVADGTLELRRRQAASDTESGDFLILLDGRVLMTSAAHRSERALAERALEGLLSRGEDDAPRVLIGGLGMGYTLRAALDRLPPGASVRVSELQPTILEWCRGPLAELTDDAARDPRVEIRIEDVASAVALAGGTRAAGADPAERYDAILLDLYEGPHARTPPGSDPVYGSRALERTARALHRDGRFAVWSEAPDAGFEKRLRGAGFRFERHRAGRGGRRHAVYVARLSG